MSTKLLTKLSVLAAVIGMLATTSCVDSQYNLDDDNINTDLIIGADGITVKLGTTKETSVSELLNLVTTSGTTKTGVSEDFLKTDESGNMYYEYTGSMTAKDVSLNYTLENTFATELPPFIKDAAVGDGNKLELSEAALQCVVDITPDVTSPLKAVMSVKGYNNDNLVGTVNATLDPVTEGKKYWLSSTTNALPEGAEYINIPFEDFINAVPDRIDPSLAMTCPDPKARGTIKVDYTFTVPLIFSSGTKIAYEFDNPIPFKSIGEIAAEGLSVIIETVKNSIPFDIGISLEIYDKDGNVLTGVEAASDGIIPGNSLNNSNPLSIKLTEKTAGAFKQMADVKLKLSLAPSINRAVINENQSIQLEMKLKFEGGVKIEI